MGFEAQSQSISFNESYTFTFANPIQQYVAGISGFFITYGSGVYNSVQTMAVGVNIISVSGNSITVAPRLLMWDGDNGFQWGSNVTITILAYTGSANNPNLLLITDTQNNPIQLPSTTPLTATSILTGFSLNYADDNPHYIQYLQAGIGLIQGNGSVSATGNACMCDSTSHYSNPTTVNTGLIINCDPSLTLSVTQITSLNGSLSNIPSQAIFLTGFFYFYQAYQISTVQVSSSIDGNTISGGLTCWYCTTSSNSSSEKGSVNLVAINF